jgi:hypothetical protein
LIVDKRVEVFKDEDAGRFGASALKDDANACASERSLGQDLRGLDRLYTSISQRRGKDRATYRIHLLHKLARQPDRHTLQIPHIRQ